MVGGRRAKSPWLQQPIIDLEGWVVFDLLNSEPPLPDSWEDNDHQKPKMSWLKRLGLAGFLFFLIKGLVWLAVNLFRLRVVWLITSGCQACQADILSVAFFAVNLPDKGTLESSRTWKQAI